VLLAGLQAPRAQWQGLAAAPAFPPVGLLDLVDEFVLGHLRPAGDVEATGKFDEVLLARVGVDALGGVALGLRASALGPLVGRAAPALPLPVVAHLLVTVLEGAVGDAVRPFTLAVFLGGSVVRLGERALGVVLGTLQSARQFTFLGLAVAGPAQGVGLRAPQGVDERGQQLARRQGGRW